MMFFGPWDFGSGYYWLMTLSMIFWWIALIVAMVFGVRWLIGTSSSQNAGSQPNAALEILKMRYARGEIEKEEFETVKKAISR
ncbi:MAG: SHOCT domain-containing protein [Actinobacteria bacterium]|nr:SHOCT domain-containing protein [Actinomycetota bacterium]